MSISAKITRYYSTLLFLILISSCTSEQKSVALTGEPESKKLTIFFTNDMHGRLENFAKIKHIVEEQKKKGSVLLMSGGDIFSGNPIVDQYPEKGYPIIDIMNQTGYDISVIGNHEFDYGIEILNDRLDQAEFDWVCANVDVQRSGLQQPNPYKTLEIDGTRITVLGLVETNGKPNAVIPSTHPWRVVDLSFQQHENLIASYQKLKESEESDLVMALTHLGSRSEFALAENHPWLDLIIGGHTNDLNSGTINDIPVLMAGGNLSHLGQIDLVINDQRIESFEVELIDLGDYEEVDADLAAAIAEYSSDERFSEVVGFAASDHDRTEVGCFYTTALKEFMQVDATFQNRGGVRANLDQGDISSFEIYTIDPFNNGSVIFTMTVEEVKNFFKETGKGMIVSGIALQRSGNDIMIYGENGTLLPNDMTLNIGMNDYIPAVNEDYFPYAEADIQELTTAESLIGYLQTIQSTVDFEGCNQYFKY